MSLALAVRVVIDPGVLLSAALTDGGSPDRLLGSWVAGDLQVAARQHQLGELAEVLRREKFRPLWPAVEAEEFVEAIARAATIHSDPVVEAGVTPDPKDDYLPALAGRQGSTTSSRATRGTFRPTRRLALRSSGPCGFSNSCPRRILAAHQFLPRRAARLAAWRAGRPPRQRSRLRSPGSREGLAQR